MFKVSVLSYECKSVCLLFFILCDVLESDANKCQEDITYGVSHFRVSGTIIDNDCRIMLCHIFYSLSFFEKFSAKIGSHLFFKFWILTRKNQKIFFVRCQNSIVRGEIRIVYCGVFLSFLVGVDMCRRNRIINNSNYNSNV